MVRTLAIASILILTLTTPAPAASASFDFLFSMNSVQDDGQLFLNLTVGSYGTDRGVLEPVLPRIRAVEVDLPVILFLADASGRPIDFIVDLRRGGLSWMVVFERCGVSPDLLFVGLDTDPGPPYGKAWGHWRKSPRSLRLSDAEVVGLVNLQVGSRNTRTGPGEIARAHGGGSSIASIAAAKKGRPYKEAGSHKGDSYRGRGKRPKS
jgi:hypothetical protein